VSTLGRRGIMLKRNHIVVLIAIPIISIVVAWVFCLQVHLQQIALQNIWLAENLKALQERLDGFNREAETEAFPTAQYESEAIQASSYLDRKETITVDSPIGIVHIVQAGENLHIIGMKYGISWKTLVKHNSLDSPNTIYAGQELKIPLSPSRITNRTSMRQATHSRLH
jgi:hypothetical protein